MKYGVLLVLFLVACAIAIPLRAQEQAATKEDLEEVKGALPGVSESAADYRG
jgi:hypothetical protein